MPSLRFVIGTLALLLIFYEMASAQTTRPADGERPMQRLQAALDKLDLSADQKQQVDQIKQEMAETVRGLAPTLKDLPADQRREKIKAALGDYREKFAAVLTPEQKAQFREGMQGRAAAKEPIPGRKPLADLKRDAKTDGDPPMVAKLRSALDNVGLTAEQKPKVDAILADVSQQARQLRQDAAGGDRDGVREKAAPLLRDVRAKLAAVLTDEQKKKLVDAMPRMGRGKTFDNDTPSTRPSNSAAVKTAAEFSASAFATTGPASAAVGQPAPAFSLAKLNSVTVTNKTFAGRPLVLIFASLSSPTLRDRMPALQTFTNRNRSRAAILMVYTREQHPADGWQVDRNTDEHVEINQAYTLADRQAAAKELRDSTKTPIEIAVDGIDDATAAAFAAASDTAVVVSPGGVIVGRQTWVDPSGLNGLIDAAVKAGQPKVQPPVPPGDNDADTAASVLMGV